MPVTVNSTKLQTRLRAFITNLYPAVASGLAAAAYETIQVVDNATRSEWSGDNTQIGFDIDSFSASIQGVTATGDGFGILNVNQMGTAADFEQIGTDTGLWHEGGHRGDAFRRFVIERPGQPEALAQLRKAIWGTTNPQWWFLEYGNEQFTGAFPVTRGSATINSALIDSAGNVQRVIEETVTSRLRAVGVY
jgi:hypothetical protein